MTHERTTPGQQDQTRRQRTADRMRTLRDIARLLHEEEHRVRTERDELRRVVAAYLTAQDEYAGEWTDINAGGEPSSARLNALYRRLDEGRARMRALLGTAAEQAHDTAAGAAQEGYG